MKEINGIKIVYGERKKKISSCYYSIFNDGNLFLVQRREYEIIRFLKRYGFKNLVDMKILDLGRGVGVVLRDFIKYGARPENLCGIDLLEDRIELAKILSPNINFICGDASNLPYEAGFFDIVIQFTVFTSILDLNMKKNIAQEMLRVLKPDGIIICYDFWIKKPTNSDVRGIPKNEIRKLFPNCKFDFNKITLAPAIARTVASYSYLMCYLFVKFKIFNTPYLASIKKL